MLLIQVVIQSYYYINVDKESDAQAHWYKIGMLFILTTHLSYIYKD